MSTGALAPLVQVTLIQRDRTAYYHRTRPQAAAFPWKRYPACVVSGALTHDTLAYLYVCVGREGGGVWRRAPLPARLAVLLVLQPARSAYYVSAG